MDYGDIRSFADYWHCLIWYRFNLKWLLYPSSNTYIQTDYSFLRNEIVTKIAEKTIDENTVENITVHILQYSIKLLLEQVFYRASASSSSSLSIDFSVMAVFSKLRALIYGSLKRSKYTIICLKPYQTTAFTQLTTSNIDLFLCLKTTNGDFIW